MFRVNRHFLLAPLTLVLSCLATQAQVRPSNPYRGRNPFVVQGTPVGQTIRHGGVVSLPQGLGFQPFVPRGVGYYPYAGGYGAYFQNPYAGYLNGISSVIDAQGQYAISYNQARLLNQQVLQERVRTRRMLFDQRRYEQALKPTLNQIREKQQYEALRRALNDPPLTEILNADALNTILINVQKQHSVGNFGPVIPLRQDLIGRVNVTPSTGGNIGAFRDGGKLAWPLPLRVKAFEVSRERIDGLAKEVVRQAQESGIQAETLINLKRSIQALQRQVKALVRDMPLQEYISAKRYAEKLEDGVKALESPDASNYFNQKWSAQGRSVGELVQHLTSQGLRFAPALQTDTTAYQALHQKLVEYGVAINQALARKNAGSPKR